MPNVLTVAGYKFYIWPDDHEPPHVHVSHAGKWAIIHLQTVALRGVPGMNRKEARRAVELATMYQAQLLEAWRQIHG